MRIHSSGGSEARNQHEDGDLIAQSRAALTNSDPNIYHGGPILQPEIVSIYWGSFSTTEIDDNQTYLGRLAQYISGTISPTGQQPTVSQYGVVGATLGIKAVDSSLPSGAISDANVRSKIASLQASGAIPAYGPERVFMVFTKGISFQPLPPDNLVYEVDWCAYHGAVGTNQWYGVSPMSGSGSNCYPWMKSTSHEVFEAATDPIGTSWTNNSVGHEVADNCDNTWENPGLGAIAKISDNLQDGACTIFTREQLPQAIAVSSGVWTTVFAESSTRTLLAMSLGILDLGGAFTSPPVALGGVGGSGTLDVFGQGTDNAFYHKAWNGSAWVPSSPNQWDAVNGQGLGRLNGRPAVVSPSANRIDVFGQGTDGAVYHKANLGSGWPAGWDFVGGVFNGPPTVVLRGSTFEIFGRGTDGNYYRQSWSGSGGFSNSWEGPLFPGDALISEPTVVSNGSSMDLFGQNAAGRYEVRTWTPSGWSLNVYLLPGVYIGPPVAAWQGGHPGLLDVVGQGTNTYYYHVQRVNGVWSGLDGASGGAGFGAGTLLPISSGTQLWVEGTDHNYYVNTITGSSWSGFSGGGGSGMMH